MRGSPLPFWCTRYTEGSLKLLPELYLRLVQGRLLMGEPRKAVEDLIALLQIEAAPQQAIMAA